MSEAEPPLRPDVLPPTAAGAPAASGNARPLPPEVLAFQFGLHRRTPRVWATPALVAINVGVFVAMAVAGVGVMSPSIDGLIRWGANYGPLTTSGQWWRILTNVFVHIGLVHVAMNMIGLWQIGFLVERLLGNRGFLAVYFFAGIGGALASVLWNPFVVSAGASGAVFGVYGALLAFLLRHRGSIPAMVLQPLMRSALIFVGLNIVFGMQVKGIDMAAHAGGFGAGFLGALLVGRPVASPAGRRAAVREFGLLALTAGLLLVVPRVLPPVPDLQAELRAFDSVERAALDAYNKAIDPARELPDAEIAQIIEQQVLSPWRQFGERWQRLRQVRRLPAQQRETVERLGRYLDLRTRGWATIAEGLRAGDQARAAEGVALLRESTRIAEEQASSAPDDKQPKPNGKKDPLPDGTDK